LRQKSLTHSHQNGPILSTDSNCEFEGIGGASTGHRWKLALKIKNVGKQGGSKERQKKLRREPGQMKQNACKYARLSQAS